MVNIKQCKFSLTDFFEQNELVDFNSFRSHDVVDFAPYFAKHVIANVNCFQDQSEVVKYLTCFDRSS